jgi:hypothetical protein
LSSNCEQKPGCCQWVHASFTAVNSHRPGSMGFRLTGQSDPKIGETVRLFSSPRPLDETLNDHREYNYVACADSDTNINAPVDEI